MFIISSFYFFCFSIIAIFVVFLPKELSNLNYSFLEISIILSMIPISRFIMPFINQKYFKITQNIFRFSSIIFLLSSILFVLYIKNYYLTLFFLFIMGLSFSLLLPFVENIAIYLFGKEKYGHTRLFGSIGFIVTTISIPYIQEYIKILYSMIILNILIIFCIFLIKDKIKDKEIKEPSFRLNDFIYIWLVLFFMQISFGGFYNFYTIYELEHGFSITTITLLFSFGVLCEIFIFIFQKQILSQNTLIFFIKISIIATIIRWLLIHFFPDNLIIMFISQSLHAFSFALFHSSIAIHLFIIYEKNPLSQQFIGGIGYGIGAFLGSIIAGYLYGENLFLFEAFFSFISFIFILKHQNFLHSQNN
jgi:PPP family 3-phenylpropionic acid transporter